MKSIVRNAGAHLVPLVVFFLIVSALFFDGIFSNKVLNQHDILQWRGAAQEAIEYRESNGEEALWTNSMFSGMPAFLVSTKYWGDFTSYIQQLISLGIPRPYSLVFLAMACFYVLMQTYRLDRWASIISSIAYGCTTYVTIGVLAGHNARIAAIAFIPLVIAGMKLVFDKKYTWGFALTALGLALEIRVDHLQITYYLALIVLIFGISHIINLIKAKELKELKIQAPVLLVAALLAVGANYGKLSTTISYSKHTTRGSSDLENKGSGLEKDYAFEFSNSIAEPLVLFIPNFYGGASNQELGKNSHLAKALEERGVPRNQVKQNIQSVPTYWGKQRLSAPYYAGAAIVFLAVLGIFYADKSERNWILIVVGLGIVLSWGDNFKLLNYFLFDYLPGYNKFRSVTFTILMSVFGLTMLAALGLQKIVATGKIPSLKQFLIAAGATGGFALLAAILAGVGSYEGAVDAQLAGQAPDWYLDAIREDRQRLLKLDAFRSAFVVLLVAGALWLSHRQKISLKLAIYLIVGVSVLDLLDVNKRYIKSSAFQEDIVENYFKPTEADQRILTANTSGARVLNLQGSFNNESKTSYLHSSIGGYHGAKLGRYQDLIERGILPEINRMVGDLQSGNPNFDSYHILNMLNTGFYKYGDGANAVIANPQTNGNAWFVENVTTVNSALEEINETLEINTKNTAVIDGSKFSYSNQELGGGTVSLKSKTPRELTYTAQSEKGGLVVFSEIYYPDGWSATIGGKEVDIFRANYVLRALKVPAGTHEIVFAFNPKTVRVGNWIMAICSGLIILSFVGVSAKSLLRQ